MDIAALRRLFVDGGALFFRGFSAPLSGFRTLARAFVGQVRLGPIHRRRHRLYPDVQTATEGTAAMPLHVEYGSMPGRVEAFCLLAEVPGAPSYVCDGVALWNALSPSTQRHFLDHPVRYVAVHLPAVWAGSLRHHEL